MSDSSIMQFDAQVEKKILFPRVGRYIFKNKNTGCTNN